MIPNIEQGERRVSNTDRARTTMRRRRDQSDIPSAINLIPHDLIDACVRTILLISFPSSQQSLLFPFLLLPLTGRRGGVRTARRGVCMNFEATFRGARKRILLAVDTWPTHKGGDETEKGLSFCPWLVHLRLHRKKQEGIKAHSTTTSYIYWAKSSERRGVVAAQRTGHLR